MATTISQEAMALIQQKGECLESAGREADNAGLVARAQQGDGDAVTELYRRHHTRIYNLCLRMTGNAWDAADLTQETFIRALGAFGSFKGEAKFATWLHRIAVNLVYDSLRRRRLDTVDEETLCRLADSASQSVRGQTELPEDGLSLPIRAALLSLSDGLRFAVVLCDLLGFSYTEAAQILEVQEGTIKSRLFRARVALAEKLREQGYAAGLGGNLSPPLDVRSKSRTTSEGD